MFSSKTFKVCLLIFILVFTLKKIHIFLEQDSCLDLGQVWDYSENRCRNDCLAITRNNGCIKMTIEQVKIFADCRHKQADCIPSKVFDEICLNNDLPMHKKTGNCDLEFSVDDCAKLNDEWTIPKRCFIQK